jgi:hypothetical protein
MALQPTTSTIPQSNGRVTRDRDVFPAGALSTAGYRALLLLGFLLPFDLERRPLLRTGYLTVTNLTLELLAISTVALISVLALGVQALRGSPPAARYFSQRRLALTLLVLFMGSCLITTSTARLTNGSASWFLGVLTGALLWLALPLWLAENTESRINRFGMTLVAGALAASLVGFVEISLGPSFDRNLLAFKTGPYTVGPWLRLTATFSSPNVAAMYFEFNLLCTVAGLLVALKRTTRRWVHVVAWFVALDVLLVALGLTYSRGALLGLLSSGLVMVLAGRHGWRGSVVARRVLGLGAGNLALVCGFFAVTSSSIELLRFSTQNDRTWYQATYRSTVPTTLKAGTSHIIPVTVENRSPLLWNASSHHTYGLSYHWLYPSRKVARFTNNITWLSAEVPPGARRTVHARVVAPAAPGTYLLSWDMIWEGTTWFDPKTGIFSTQSVRVVEPTASSGASHPIQHALRPDITYLPAAPALSRLQIWRVAVRMIEQHPLFGEGSQGIRMNYRAYDPRDPAGRPVKPPVHAHDLALEMLADWGIVGGGLFAALLVVLWWPFIRGVVAGDVTSAWELAVIGAAAALLGHQLVDYFLSKQHVFAVLWLLCGLAGIMSQRPSAGSRPSASATNDPR